MGMAQQFFTLYIKNYILPISFNFSAFQFSTKNSVVLVWFEGNLCRVAHMDREDHLCLFCC